MFSHNEKGGPDPPPLVGKKRIPVLALLLAMKLVTRGNRLNCTICHGENMHIQNKQTKNINMKHLNKNTVMTYSCAAIDHVHVTVIFLYLSNGNVSNNMANST